MLGKQAARASLQDEARIALFQSRPLLYECKPVKTGSSVNTGRHQANETLTSGTAVTSFSDYGHLKALAGMRAYPPPVCFKRQGVLLALRVRQRPLRQLIAIPVHDQPELVQPCLLRAGKEMPLRLEDW